MEKSSWSKAVEGPQVHYQAQEKCPDSRAGLIAAKNTQTATKNVT